MSIKYNLTPIEIIKHLGYTEPLAKEELEQFKKDNHLKLPTMLFNFLSFAQHNPLFSTADIWTGDNDNLLPYFFYEYIEGGIEDCREDFDDPEFCAGNVFYIYFKAPKEQWSELVSNYLLIGSDYAAGVVHLGIEEKDLTLENPPVYLLHEADTLADWKLLFTKLSDYLMAVVLDVLACKYYSTAERVLHKKGWEFCKDEYANEEEVKERLAKNTIDLSAMAKHISCFNPDSFYRCCFDEEMEALYLVENDESVLVIQAE